MAREALQMGGLCALEEEQVRPQHGPQPDPLRKVSSPHRQPRRDGPCVEVSPWDQQQR